MAKDYEGNEPSKYKTDEDKRLKNCQSKAMRSAQCATGYGESTAEYPVVRGEKLVMHKVWDCVRQRGRRERRQREFEVKR